MKWSEISLFTCWIVTRGLFGVLIINVDNFVVFIGEVLLGDDDGRPSSIWRSYSHVQRSVLVALRGEGAFNLLQVVWRHAWTLQQSGSVDLLLSKSNQSKLSKNSHICGRTLFLKIPLVWRMPLDSSDTTLPLLLFSWPFITGNAFSSIALLRRLLKSTKEDSPYCVSKRRRKLSVHLPVVDLRSSPSRIASLRGVTLPRLWWLPFTVITGLSPPSRALNLLCDFSFWLLVASSFWVKRNEWFPNPHSNSRPQGYVIVSKPLIRQDMLGSSWSTAIFSLSSFLAYLPLPQTSPS